MKKQYIKPQMEVVKIETAQMLAASSRSFNNQPIDVYHDSADTIDEGDVW